MRHSLTAAILGLACLLPAQNAQRSPEPIAKVIEAAQKLRLRGDEVAAQSRMREVLEREPDHLEARAFLGYEFFRGRWRLPEEMAYLRRAAERSEAEARAAEAAAAPAPAKAPAPSPMNLPVGALLRPQQQPANPVVIGGMGLFDLRLQWVQNLGMDTVPVSFGVGAPGRIQLPRTQSESFGGGVWLPLGFGR